MPARAQTAAEDPTTEAARARFKEGVGFYDKGQFEQARASFLQAYALKKHPAVLLNLAWSSLKSGHVLEAEHFFKQFLNESKDITDKQRADANDGLNQTHAKLGRIDVAAAAGTEVTVDGEKAGTTPLSDPILVEPGAHTVKFKGADAATDTDSVTVLAGEKAIARFAKTAAAAPPVAATTPPPAGTDTEAPPPPPPSDETPKAAEAPAAKESVNLTPHRDLLSPPATIAPVIVGGVLVLGSAAVAITMLASKHTAQNKANDTAAGDRRPWRSVVQPSRSPAGCAEFGYAAASRPDLGGVQPVPGRQRRREHRRDHRQHRPRSGRGRAGRYRRGLPWLVADRKSEPAVPPHRDPS